MGEYRGPFVILVLILSRTSCIYSRVRVFEAVSLVRISGPDTDHRVGPLESVPLNYPFELYTSTCESRSLLAVPFRRPSIDCGFSQVS